VSDGVQRVEDLRLYQLLYELALDLERATRGLPSDFKWLRGQALRSSESTCANLTEGFYAQYSTEFLQSLYRVRREARETMMHLRYARDAGAMPGEVADGFEGRYEAVSPMISGLISSIERKILTHGKSKPAVHEEMSSYEISPREPLTTNH
jgi:four helix bundle protein